jgi:hypothetical protein
MFTEITFNTESNNRYLKCKTVYRSHACAILSATLHEPEIEGHGFLLKNYRKNTIR